MERLLLVIISVTSVTVSGYGAKPNPQTPPVYSVDLNNPARTRWNHVTQDYKYMVPQIEKTLSQLVPSEVRPVVDLIAERLDDTILEPYADEMRGIAEVFGVKLGDIVLLNLIYDITAWCTSIVAMDDHGVVWHARNLDYYYGDILRNMTIVARFMKDKQEIFAATTYAGYVGVVTAQKAYRFSVTIDQRGHRIHVGYLWQNLLVALFDKQSSYVTFLVRQVMEGAGSYSDAVDILSHTVLHAPVYFIVAGSGPREGVVITRDRLAAANQMFMGSKWFVLETNYDNWTTPPPWDNRRSVKAITDNDERSSCSNEVILIIRL
ncbi:hypothetical protein ScPMuIL_008206 [Solemya velum]